MCLACQRETARNEAQAFAQGGSLQGTLLGGALSLQCRAASRQAPALNSNCAPIPKNKLAEVVENMEKTYMMIPSCQVRDKLEADAEYLRSQLGEVW